MVVLRVLCLLDVKDTVLTRVLVLVRRGLGDLLQVRTVSAVLVLVGLQARDARGGLVAASASEAGVRSRGGVGDGSGGLGRGGARLGRGDNLLAVTRGRAGRRRSGGASGGVVVVLLLLGGVVRENLLDLWVYGTIEKPRAKWG